MEYLELTVDTTQFGVEFLPTVLEDAGITSVMIDDDTDFQDFLQDNQEYWGSVDEDLIEQKTGLCRITFYVEHNEKGLEQLQQVQNLFDGLRASRNDLGDLILQSSQVASEDWEYNWKKFYKPMEIGERLMVIPSWENTSDSSRVHVVLNPGLTFGTGTHTTTRLCLEALDRLVTGGEFIADLGCGSGILSIAGLKLGAKEAFACDIDEKCMAVAYENAELSGIDKNSLTVRCCNILEDSEMQKFLTSKCNIVIANIVADVIIGLSPLVGKFLRKRGLFLTSGIIDTRRDDVYSQLVKDGWIVLEETSDDGWVSFLCSID